MGFSAPRTLSELFIRSDRCPRAPPFGTPYAVTPSQPMAAASAKCGAGMAADWRACPRVRDAHRLTINSRKGARNVCGPRSRESSPPDAPLEPRPPCTTPSSLRKARAGTGSGTGGRTSGRGDVEMQHKGTSTRPRQPFPETWSSSAQPMARKPSRPVRSSLWTRFLLHVTRAKKALPAS